MDKNKLDDLLQEALDDLYHNATLSYISTDSDFEADLLESEIHMRVQCAFEDIGEVCPFILKWGKIYQWGRGGRTVAPDKLIRQRGGESFSIKKVEDLELDEEDKRQLLSDLSQFNAYVKQWCKETPKDALEYIRQVHGEEIKANEGKKRVHYSGVKYV